MAYTDSDRRFFKNTLAKVISCNSAISGGGSGSVSYEPLYNNGSLSGYVAYISDGVGGITNLYLDDTGVPTLTAPLGSIVKTIDNRHAEVLDTGSLVLTGVANYSYSILSGSATVTINGVTISGLPAMFDARQGETNPDQLLNDITITGDSIGSRIIVYYELA